MVCVWCYEFRSSQDEEELVSESSFQLSDIRRYTDATSTNTMKTNQLADECSTSSAMHLQQHGESGPLPSSSFLESKVNSLKEMFPVVSTECITQALHENNGDVLKAVNTLLGDIGLVLKNF